MQQQNVLNLQFSDQSRKAFVLGLALDQTAQVMTLSKSPIRNDCDDEAERFFDLLWSEVSKRFLEGQPVTQSNYKRLVAKISSELRILRVGDVNAPNERQILNWLTRESVPQGSRLDILLVAMYGTDWSFNETASELKARLKKIWSLKRGRYQTHFKANDFEYKFSKENNRVWRQERIGMLDGDSLRNSEPLAQIIVHPIDETCECITPIIVTMTQGIDEFEVEHDGYFLTFNVSLMGSRLSVSFEGCGFESGSRLGETSEPVVVPSSTGVVLSGGIWKIPGQSSHQRPIGDEPLFSLRYPSAEPCAFGLVLSCRNRQINVCLDCEQGTEATSPLREKVIQAYVQKVLSQHDDGIVEITRLRLTRN